MDETKITIISEDGEEEQFVVLEETKINDISYLLVAEPEEMEDEEVTVYIIKDVSAPEDKEAVYEFVYDEVEEEAIAKVFAELLEEDTDLQI